MADPIDAFVIAVLSITAFGIVLNLVSIALKLSKDFNNPKLWKYSLLYLDVAHVILGVGIVFIASACKVSEFCILFGLFECVCAFLTAGIILLCIQNPGKASQLSSFHRNVFLIIVFPQFILPALLSSLPLLPLDIFNRDDPYPIKCIPIRLPGDTGGAYGALIFTFLWLVVLAAFICCVLSALKLWKFYNRVNSAQPNVWQFQLLIQGKNLLKILLAEECIWVGLLSTFTLLFYVEFKDVDAGNGVMTCIGIETILHGIFSNLGNAMWGTCCCRGNQAVEDPHRKLKKLELIKIESAGKLRMKATWNIGKGATRRGLMKVYGAAHLKAWAQEIVILGMLRKTQHPSLLQCLWTSSSNPYYETMTLITGEIITSDSRIICLESTNGGTLHDFLNKAELPLPEPCQRMIVHDIAEGLFYLHHENILHSNLSSTCIYLKGSLQSMVLRAAVGDFEDAHVYGSLQQGPDGTFTDKKYFFLPDIRSFALIALEIVSKMCEKRFQNRYVNYDSDHHPMKLNLAGVISDDEDNFEEQYGYEAEDTHRMFESVQSPVPQNKKSEKKKSKSSEFDIKNEDRGSLENLMDRERPMSPDRLIGNRVSSPEPVFPYHSSEVPEIDVDDKGRPSTPTPRGRPVEKQVDRQSRSLSPIAQREKKHKSSKSRSKSQPPERCSSPTPQLSPNRVQSPILQSPIDIERGASPDPMKDAKLQEMRNKTEDGKSFRKERKKVSFSKRQDLEKQKLNQAFESYPDHEKSKRKDSNILSKPGSILKTVTGAETKVSVFKAKTNEEDDECLDIIDEEVMPVPNRPSRKQRPKLEKKKSQEEVWDIINEQYYRQLNRKAMKNLKKTVSAESTSSLWSFISTPEDLDEHSDDLDGILGSLPGMADPDDLRRSRVTMKDILASREKARKEKRGFAYDSSTSKFELIDYYETLKENGTLDKLPSAERQILETVYENAKEETEDESRDVIKSDEMYNTNMNPVSNQKPGKIPVLRVSNPGNELPDGSNQKVKVVSFRRNQQMTTSTQQPVSDSCQSPEETDPRKIRARSAPLKRSRTPMQKTPEVNPAFIGPKPRIRKTRARTALQRALSNRHRHSPAGRMNDQAKSRDQPNVALKYATVKKLQTGQDGNNNLPKVEQIGTNFVVPIPTSESFSVSNSSLADSSITRYPSLESNASSSSYASSVNVRKADTSLTSGEMTSLSSQAESDHFETDGGHTTDAEGPVKLSQKYKKKTAATRVDSGFDSGSMSSEMSSDLMGRSKQYYNPMKNPSSGLSWTKSYQVSTDVPRSTPNYQQHRYTSPIQSGCRVPSRPKTPSRETFTPTPVNMFKSTGLDGMFEEHRVKSPSLFGEDEDRVQSPTLKEEKRIKSPMERTFAVSSNAEVGPSPRVIEVCSVVSPPRTIDLTKRALSPIGSENSISSSTGTSSKSKDRVKSPTYSSGTMSPPSQNLREITPSPHSSCTKSPPPMIKVDHTDPQAASKRYRELVKKGVPMRASVVEASSELPSSNSRLADRDHGLHRTETLESVDEPVDDQKLFSDLDSKGFFRSRSPSPTKSVSSSPTKHLTNGTDSLQRHNKGKKGNEKQIPLEQIIREVPESKAQSPHLLNVSGEEAYLNQPTSEDSETCSIRTTKSSVSVPSGAKPKIVVDAELVIDRIYSHNQAHGYDQLDVEVEAALGLDQDMAHAFSEFYEDNNKDLVDLDNVSLLNGMQRKHVDSCVTLASGLHVLTVSDLLPAKRESFDTLRKKLQQVGQIGTVGNQLLDIICKCWLNDMPPTSGDLVEQLTDPVTETEV